MAYPIAVAGPSYYYCHGCRYYIQTGFYCAHTYYGNSPVTYSNNRNNYMASHGARNSCGTRGGDVVVVSDSTRRVDHGATRTTRYSVRVYSS